MLLLWAHTVKAVHASRCSKRGGQPERENMHGFSVVSIALMVSLHSQGSECAVNQTPTHLLSQLGHHGGSPGAGATAHARSDEDEISAL